MDSDCPSGVVSAALRLAQQQRDELHTQPAAYWPITVDVLAVGEDWKDIVRTHKEPNHERMFIPHIAGDGARTDELDGTGM